MAPILSFFFHFSNSFGNTSANFFENEKKFIQYMLGRVSSYLATSLCPKNNIKKNWIWVMYPVDCRDLELLGFDNFFNGKKADLNPKLNEKSH
jgi:hypothetical protein